MVKYINQFKSHINHRLLPLQKNVQQLIVSSRSRDKLKRIYESHGKHKTLLLSLEFLKCNLDPLKCKLKLNEGYVGDYDFACVNLDCNGMFQIVTKKENLYLVKGNTLDYKSSLQKQGFCLI